MNGHKHTHSCQIKKHRWSWPVTLRPCDAVIAGFPHWLVFIGIIRIIRFVSIVFVFLQILLNIFIALNYVQTAFRSRVLHLLSSFSSLNQFHTLCDSQGISIHCQDLLSQEKLNNPESHITHQIKSQNKKSKSIIKSRPCEWDQRK